ncbi:MAG: multidrug effflux MFS transporter [Francisellaceae bacterium]
MNGRAIKACGIPSLFILVLMISVGPFGDTIYAPSLPSIQQAFNTQYHYVQLTITFYLLGYSISQLLYGPFSDRYGRKPIMVIGAIIFLIGSGICLFSQNILMLIAGRFVQGFGACAGAVISSAAVRDAFPSNMQGRMFAKMNIAFAIAPGLGAITGTFISWQINFIVLFILAIMLTICVLFMLPETLKQKNKGATRPIRLIKNYMKLFITKGYLVYLLLLGLNMGMIYSCLVEAPALVINLMQLSKPWFIVIAAGIVLAFMCGSILCNWLCHHLRHHYIILIGFIVSLAGGMIMLIFSSLGIIRLTTLLLPIIVIFIGISFVVPLATAKALKPFDTIAGSASAMMGFFQMGMASLITALVTVLHIGYTYTMPVTFVVLSLTGIIIFSLYLLSGLFIKKR